MADLNGKINIGLNTTVIFSGIVAGVLLYGQVQSLAQDVIENSDHPVSSAAFLVLENELEHIKETAEENKEALGRVEEKQDEILNAIKNDPR